MPLDYQHFLDRRSFLASLVSLFGARTSGTTVAPVVQAVPTVFFAPPEGRTALVRFVVRGADAAAARLRMFDRARQQVGTAGLIRLGDALYGELWIPLDSRESSYTSELELPRVRGVTRTVHRLQARRRWLLYWATIADAAPLAARLAPLEFPYRGTALSILAAGHVAANPFPPDEDLPFLDHAPFLGSIAPVHDAVRQAGLALSPLAVAGPGQVTHPSLGVLLAGVGIKWLASPGALDSPRNRITAPGGAMVDIAPVAAGASPRELGFASGGDEMTRRIERLLEQNPLLAAPEYQAPAALIIGTDVDDVAAASAHADDWNRRFAFPRIIQGRLDDFLKEAARQPIIPGTAAAPAATAVPDAGQLARVVTRRAQERDRRPERMLAPVLQRLDAPQRDLSALAAQFAFLVPGTLVFNPSPFSRTDVAVMPDGTERIVTDVPGTGYACIPYPGLGAEHSGRWTGAGQPGLSVSRGETAIEIAPESGAVRSVESGGSQWVRPGSTWNGLAGARLTRSLLEENRGVGQRVLLEREMPDGSSVRSTVTLYDQLPWIDMVNEWTAPAASIAECEFATALDAPTVRWEVAAGAVEAPSPAERTTPLRWLSLRAGERGLTLCGIAMPVARVSDAGMISGAIAPGRSHFRVFLTNGWSAADDPWRFGWSTEPFVTAAAPGTGRASLSSFGSIIRVDQSGVVILDLRAARDGDGVVVLLQELLGVSRDITVGAGVLSFTGGRLVDFLERDLGPAAGLPGGGLAIPLAGQGVTAIRLTGVALAGV